MKNETKKTEKVTSLRSWLKLCLGLRGFTIKSFAEKHGVKPATVSAVFTRPYPRMERLIADTIGVLPESIWPARYDERGRSNRLNAWYRRLENKAYQRKPAIKRGKIREE